MTWATEQRLPAMQKIVLLMLANRTNHETGLCIPKIRTLADECGMSVRACQASIRALEAAGALEIQNRFNGGIQISNQYRLKMHPVQDMHPPMQDMRGVGAGGAGGGVHNMPTEPGRFNQEDNQCSAGKPAPVDNFAAKTKSNVEHAADLIAKLNECSGHKYQATPSTVKALVARMREGFAPDEIAEVIERKCGEWKGTKMEQFLRPKTLFNATNFESYAGQRGMKLPDVGSDERKDAPWWSSATAIESQAKIAGVGQIVGEAFWRFKCRVAKKVGDRAAMDAILGDMARTGNAAYEETARYFGVSTLGDLK